MTTAVNMKEQSPMTTIKNHFEKSIAAKQDIVNSNALDTLPKMAELMIESIKKGGKILLCGNGGSAADAQHLAAELLIRLRPNVNRQALPAMTLATDVSTLTACGNDYSFEDIFARPLEALGNENDILFAITTSGQSENITHALKVAKQKGMKTVALLGGDGGKALPLCDSAFVVPSKLTGHIQECHITAGHVLMQLVEEAFI